MRFLRDVAVVAHTEVSLGLRHMRSSSRRWPFGDAAVGKKSRVSHGCCYLHIGSPRGPFGGAAVG